MLFQIQQWIEDTQQWFGISVHDTLVEAQAELITLENDSYYMRFKFRINETEE